MFFPASSLTPSLQQRWQVPQSQKHPPPLVHDQKKTQNHTIQTDKKERRELLSKYPPSGDLESKTAPKIDQASLIDRAALARTKKTIEPTD
jgi:hypothetical protein